MPGPTAADVARATRRVAVDNRQDTAVLTRQGNARDGAAQPRPGYFDALADAATVNAAGFALIGTERRRFAVTVQDLLEPAGAFDAAQVTPAVTVVDATQSLNAAMLVSRIEIDDAAGTTTLEVFG